MILNALVERLKRRAKDDLKGRHHEASLILQPASRCWNAALVQPRRERRGSFHAGHVGRNGVAPGSTHRAGSRP